MIQRATCDLGADLHAASPNCERDRPSFNWGNLQHWTFAARSGDEGPTLEAAIHVFEMTPDVDSSLSLTMIRYIALKTGDNDNGPAWTGRVQVSRTSFRPIASSRSTFLEPSRHPS
jgi:hypothetical protein